MANIKGLTINQNLLSSFDLPNFEYASEDSSDPFDHQIILSGEKAKELYNIVISNKTFLFTFIYDVNNDEGFFHNKFSFLCNVLTSDDEYMFVSNPIALGESGGDIDYVEMIYLIAIGITEQSAYIQSTSENFPVINYIDKKLANYETAEVAGQKYALKSEIPDAVTVTDSLDSTSTTEALSANQGKILNEKIPTGTADLTNDANFIKMEKADSKEDAISKSQQNPNTLYYWTEGE